MLEEYTDYIDIFPVTRLFFQEKNACEFFMNKVSNDDFSMISFLDFCAFKSVYYKFSNRLYVIYAIENGFNKVYLKRNTSSINSKIIQQGGLKDENIKDLFYMETKNILLDITQEEKKQFFMHHTHYFNPSFLEMLFNAKNPEDIALMDHYVEQLINQEDIFKLHLFFSYPWEMSWRKNVFSKIGNQVPSKREIKLYQKLYPFFKYARYDGLSEISILYLHLSDMAPLRSSNMNYRPSDNDLLSHLNLNQIGVNLNSRYYYKIDKAQKIKMIDGWLKDVKQTQSLSELDAEKSLMIEIYLRNLEQMLKNYFGDSWKDKVSDEQKLIIFSTIFSVIKTHHPELNEVSVSLLLQFNQMVQTVNSNTLKYNTIIGEEKINEQYATIESILERNQINLEAKDKRKQVFNTNSISKVQKKKVNDSSQKKSISVSNREEKTIEQKIDDQKRKGEKSKIL